MISRAMEDYLKLIHLLSSGGSRVSTSQLAVKKSCSAASVTNMLQKLSDLKLVSYRRYRGVTLTDAGSKVALEVIRHHRLIELYLQEVLGYSWDEVHEEADELEHVISEEFEARIDEALGYPERDPHGHPIPRKDGQLPVESSVCLWDIEGPCQVGVSRVSDEDPKALRYLAEIGILPDSELGIEKRTSLSEPICIQIDDASHILDEQVARQIFVTTL